MSQETLEALQRGFDAVSRLDGEAMLAEMDPEIEFCPRFQVMLGGEEAVFRGHDGFREAFRDLYGALEWIKPEIYEVRDLGDLVVALGRLSVKGKSSGAEASSEAGWVAEAKDGKAVRFTEYLSHGEALAAAGLDG
jgi:uncharacterized protein